jgi:hypothetical protein
MKYIHITLITYRSCLLSFFCLRRPACWLNQIRCPSRRRDAAHTRSPAASSSPGPVEPIPKRWTDLIPVKHRNGFGKTSARNQQQLLLTRQTEWLMDLKQNPTRWRTLSSLACVDVDLTTTSEEASTTESEMMTVHFSISSRRRRSWPFFRGTRHEDIFWGSVSQFDSASAHDELILFCSLIGVGVPRFLPWRGGLPRNSMSMSSPGRPRRT